ncbi:hypothetical protein [Nocardia cyriacigeorgica]|uniref:Uncharacterized protein n=1 Tax=Nocardia cyriacigeorgica TaxID=135487 RepID=A0A5R8NB04_9NOCA|nr:hypothetical protein [Nocardia cyriacigeorgica]TLF72891.1 hypothetical protein FEK34_28115 [Nocardia cyriacigeorgica]
MAKQEFSTGDYVEVSERIVEFRTLHPAGSLRPVDPTQPYRIERVGDDTFIVVVAAAYRSPDDLVPGIGMAWETYPGRTNFTRGSELQNAETSAWGRAIVAALAADTKRGIASADEVRARTATAAAQLPAHDFARAELLRLLNARGISGQEATAKFAADNNGAELRTSTDAAAIEKLIRYYEQAVTDGA